jgi:hypothetical protein
MSDYVLGYWRPIFQDDEGNWIEGIQLATGKGIAGSGVATEQNVNIVRIDLANTPGLQFYTTSSQDLSASGSTILDFFTAPDTPSSTVLAINGALAAVDGGNVYLFGAAVSSGNVVQDPTQPAVAQGAPDVRNSADAGTVALTITGGLQASFQFINAQTGLPSGWSQIYTAVAGSPNVPPGTPPPCPFNTGLLQPGEAMVLCGGVNQGLPVPPQSLNLNNGDAVWIAARTAVGLSEDKNYLFLMTVDGVEDLSMKYGASFYDVGQWLLLAGAYEGITLDGGGSTAMAMMAAQPNQRPPVPVLMNVPHGNETMPYQMRSNVQFFGVIVANVA